MTQDALLKLLEADARLSDQQIADRLGVDVATVAAKRAALEKAGRIVGYQAIVNDDGEGVSAFIEVRCTPERGGVIPTGALLFPHERGLLFMAAAG